MDKKECRDRARDLALKILPGNANMLDLNYAIDQLAALYEMIAEAGNADAGPYLVWSNEHNAWWRPAACGYTIDISQAGRYSRDGALKHSRSRDQGAGRPMPELPIREDDLRAILVEMHWTTELERSTGGA